MQKLSRKIRAAAVGLLASSVIFLAGCSNAVVNQGGEVYYNAKVFTSDDEKPEASALVVKDGKITFVGSSTEALKFAGRGAASHDMEGRLILPGLIDSHAHYLAINTWTSDVLPLQIDLALTHDQILEAVRDYAAQYPAEVAPVISGSGYGTDARPLASELDKVVSDRPVVLTNSGGHGGWANTKALEMAGITAATPDPSPGISYFVRDESGNPTGEFKEASTMSIMLQGLGLTSGKEIETRFPVFTQTVLSPYGYTAYYDAGLLVADEEESIDALSKSGADIRVFTSFVYRDPVPVDAFVSKMTAVRDKYTSDTVRPTTLKLFKDGTLEDYSSLMFEDFSDHNGEGIEILDNSHMLAIAQAAAGKGFNIHTHAIGDKAIDETLDLYQDLGDIEGTKTMAHVQILPEDGIRRFAEQTDVFYQTTPVWALGDEFTKSALGQTRYGRQMPLNTVSQNGTLLTFGSDAPVSNGLAGINPFAEMYHAVKRGESDDYDPPKSEGIDIATAIRAYTINGARQVGAGDEIGSITAGKSADFIVLDRDLLSIPTDEIKDTTVLQTFFRGDEVYNAQNPPDTAE
ncbi:amidohydrolase [Eubacterium sp. 1001713B170207_170306_E7]|uniref:amidohydrolase n=1 Tax=Eubacterium sp. 1001713B170207_170306_E7 TaxID=2787097 RepID=UPI00189C1410|nr:amidohydrolase [Eubacterium sp. 1001713B170207_170306_E7]